MATGEWSETGSVFVFCPRRRVAVMMRFALVGRGAAALERRIVVAALERRIVAAALEKTVAVAALEKTVVALL